MSTLPDTPDVVIVGAGRIGLELAVGLARAGVEYVQIEAGPIGSTMEWWAPGTRYFSSPERLEIAGVPLVTPDESKATREQYLAYLRTVARQFDLPVACYRRVERIDRLDDGFAVATRRSAHGVGGPREEDPTDGGADEPHTIRARRVVLAIGNMHRPRRLDVPGEDLPHVSHYLGEPHAYFGGRVLIVGGKNSAVEAALRCYRVGARVVMSYRGDTFDPSRVKYWLRPEIEWLIGKKRIGWHPHTVPVEITPDHVRLEPVDGGSAVTVPADHVLLLTGYVQDASLFAQLDLERRGTEDAPVVDRATMESSVPGVYVIGTAVGGTQQRARIFIENSHVHVERVVHALTGRSVPWSCETDYTNLEES
jgi:thioredoxin reductase (NADPH)